jgi:hypothetical protein
MVSATRSLPIDHASLNPQPKLGIAQNKKGLSLAVKIAIVVGAILIGAATPLAIACALTTLTPIAFVALPLAGAIVGLTVALTIISKCCGNNASKANKSAKPAKRAVTDVSDVEVNSAPKTFQELIENWLKFGKAPSKQDQDRVITNEVLKDCSPEDRAVIEAKMSNLEISESIILCIFLLTNSIVYAEGQPSISSGMVKFLKSLPNIAKDPAIQCMIDILGHKKNYISSAENQLGMCLLLVKMTELDRNEINDAIFSYVISTLAHNPDTRDMFAKFAKIPNTLVTEPLKKILAQYVVEAMRIPANFTDKSTEGSTADEILAEIILENPAASEDELLAIAKDYSAEIEEGFTNQRTTTQDLLTERTRIFENLSIQFFKWDTFNLQEVIQHPIICKLPSIIKVQLLQVLLELPEDHWEPALGSSWGLTEPIDVDFCKTVYKKLLLTNVQALNKLMETYPDFKELVETVYDDNPEDDSSQTDKQALDLSTGVNPDLNELIDSLDDDNPENDSSQTDDA